MSIPESGHSRPHLARTRAQERLVSLLPVGTVDEIAPLLDPRAPDPEGVGVTVEYAGGERKGMNHARKRREAERRG